MTRRAPLTFLLSALTLTIAFGRLAPTGSIDAAPETNQERVSKQAALSSIAKNVLLPGYADLTARCAELATAADVLAATPNAASLKQTQQAWVATLLAWRRTQAFVRGPITDLNVFGRLQFWPLRPQSIDKVLRDKGPLDAKYIDTLGATAVGLFPLERLLFDPGHDEALLATFSGPQSERRRLYVKAIAHDLETRARAAEKAWQGPNGYAASFAAGGQSSINLLINNMLEAVEVGAQARLLLIKEWNAAKVLRPEFVEAGVSAASQQALLSLLIGAEERFNGGDKAGLDDYLRTVNAPTAGRVTTQFRKTIAAVKAIGVPLDQATPATHALIAQAHEESRALEILLKTDAASALGVTLTFLSVDGD